MADGDVARKVRERLTQAGEGGVLRFITCGSVDDGKSTLIGRLLFDSKLLFEDQIRILKQDSKKHGTAGEEIDFALLLDGLEAEREQGITIDVAYRFFNTERRKFIVADTPGHEQYTRNMATGASTADLAIILVDARKGVLTQTKRHTYIANMMGIRHAVLAVNKMDLVGYSRAAFHEIVSDYMNIVEDLGFASVTPVPLSARYGDNIFQRADSMKWYDGPTLMEHLESVDTTMDEVLELPFRLPIQWVNRPNLDFRGFSGTIVGGRLKKGDDVCVAHSGKVATVSRIVTADSDLDQAANGDAVTIVLDREIDIARGDMLVDPKSPTEVSDQFAAEILWMTDEKMFPGRSYLLKAAGGQMTPASVTTLKHKLNVNTFEKEPGKSLDLNEIGVCTLSTSKPIAFDKYADQRETGSFILIDRFTNQTVAAGMIEFSLRRASNIHTHAMDIDKARRSELKNQKPTILWFTGLSGAGKSTVANLVERKLADNGRHTYSLDGDNVRQGLNRDLGFTDADRVENIRRIGEVAKLFVDSGMIVTCSFISPFRSERQMVRELVDEGEFVEVFVDAPLEVCIQRDPKGLYAKAKAGKIKNFTGFDSPYEAPKSPEIHINTAEVSAEDAAERVIDELAKRGLLG
ncbi:sulfate adenylyltransferase subunit CysN [Hyphobacterium sp. HN65]|uniref:Multifunctional fusion protein n=1 Tax=Hyphobacterium lacteum TaxID=3116575 RepID=A0ABU7LPN1_9PROT|nr:sulfate adenylyltransferase subunit CysN [Hyphobacterium sp. HN65]MEE2525880.1 sulfate adenylyltransferase subunit CysN [Hyphobacterium sp. HN65]